MNGYQNNIADKIKSVIKQTDPNAIAILYGSRATGKAKKDSDWDILILLNKPLVSLKEEQLFRHNLCDVELATGEAISTLVYSQQDWDSKLSITPIHHEVKKNGIVL